MIVSLGTKIFLTFPQNPIRNQEILTILLAAIVSDSFGFSFWHQEKPKQPSYISL